MAARTDWQPEWDAVPTPSYLVYEELLEKNLKILAEVAEDTGAKILLAQKCFSMYHYYPLIGRYLSGTTASGIYEARLSQEEMGKENHVFKPAYEAEEIIQLAAICDHIIFNSFAQWERFGAAARAAAAAHAPVVNPVRVPRLGRGASGDSAAGVSVICAKDKRGHAFGAWRAQRFSARKGG